MKSRSKSVSFWSGWLRVLSVGVAVFGSSLVVMPDLGRRAFGLLAYADPSGVERFGAEAVAYISLAHAVLGSVMLGWGVLLFVVSGGPFRDGRRDAWFAITLSLTLWFIPDTIFSLWSGFWGNAVLNTVFAVLFSVPLTATYRGFHESIS